MDSKKFLLNFSIKYRGDWSLIFDAIQKHNIAEDMHYTDNNYFTILDEEYPERLKNSRKPPFVIFYKGDLSLLKKDNIVSVIGCREPTSEATNALDIIAPNLDTIVVGYSKGIEEKATDLIDKSIVVLPNGLDCDKDCVDKIVKKGGLVLTEYPNGVEKTSASCMERGRIIEAIAHKSLLVEASSKSGAVLRVSFATDLGHDVYVVPHSIGGDFVNNTLIIDGAIPLVNGGDLRAN